MEFTGLLKKEHVEIPGINEKQVEFLRVIKKTLCGISMGLGLCPWNFQEV